MSNGMVVASKHSSETLISYSTDSFYEHQILSSGPVETQCYLAHAKHGYQPRNVEVLRPGTANINLQGFVFAVPGLFGIGKYASSTCQSRAKRLSREGNGTPKSWPCLSTISSRKNKLTAKTKLDKTMQINWTTNNFLVVMGASVGFYLRALSQRPPLLSARSVYAA
jgi:hypothetical protein